MLYTLVRHLRAHDLSSLELSLELYGLVRHLRALDLSSLELSLELYTLVRHLRAHEGSALARKCAYQSLAYLRRLPRTNVISGRRVIGKHTNASAQVCLPISRLPQMTPEERMKKKKKKKLNFGLVHV